MDEKLTDILERYLQGRINVCVDGLMSRIARLEENLDTLVTTVTDLSTTIHALQRENGGLELQAQGVQNMLSGHAQNLARLNKSIERYEDDTRPDTLTGEELLEKIKDCIEWNDAVGEVYGTTEFEDAVKEAVEQMTLELRVTS